MSFGPDLVVPVFHSNPMPLNNQGNLDTLVINRKQEQKKLTKGPNDAKRVIWALGVLVLVVVVVVVVLL